MNKQEVIDVDKGIDSSKGPAFGQRHVQAVMLFLGITTEMMSRFSVTLSIVAMTNNSTSPNQNIPTYDWSDTNVILSSFYWGYLVLQVLAGELGNKFGAKWLLFTAMLVNASATTLIPLIASMFGSKGVIACRILQGLGQGGIFPSCHTMLGRWAPKNERGRMATFVYSGINLGTIFCLPITGLISESYLGWPTTFYLFGGCGFLWSVLWLILGHSTPSVHPSITFEERRYIETSLSQEKDIKTVPTPWRHILTSVHVYAILIPTILTAFGIAVLQNETPTYLSKVMNYDVASSGYLTSMTALAGLVMTYVYGPLSDFLIENRYLSRVNTRKIFEILACYGSGATLIFLAFLDKSQAHLSVIMLTLASVFGSAILFGQGVNPIDISPRFAGIILAMANSMSCIMALSAPLAVQFMVTDEGNATQWRLVFLMAALSLMVPPLMFVFFASGQRQWWDDGAETKENEYTRKQNQNT